MTTSQLSKGNDGGKIQSGMMECGAILPFTKSYHNPEINNQQQNGSEHSRYPMYCYPYGITYYAIIDSYGRNQAQEHRLHTSNFQSSPLQTDHVEYLGFEHPI